VKAQVKTVYVLVEDNWKDTEFRLIKASDIFTFDKTDLFTASCDAYMIENGIDAGAWSVLVVNKEVERFQEERRRERNRMFEF